jgi:hypothetical protein
VPGDQPAVDQGVQAAVLVLANGADPALSGGNHTAVAAQRAPHLPVCELFVEQRFHYLAL